MTDINNGIHLIVKANKQALHRERSKSFVILSMIVKAWNSNEAKVQVRISQTQESKHWIQIGHKETHKDWMLDCLICRQGKTIWPRRKGTRQINTQGNDRQLDTGGNVLER